jgi:tetratricopeptide (TPR) repeat protein
MVNVTDYLVEREAIEREHGMIHFSNTAQLDSVPETIRGLIERQVDALSQTEQELLEVAAVAGTTFSIAPIARVLGQDREKVEEDYQALAANTQFLQYAGLRRRPNGRGSPRYGFVHALYQNTIYERIDEARQRRLHQAIGERTEATYAGTTETVAAELAAHFETSGDSQRAVKYLLQAAQRSISLFAYAETIDYATKALMLVKSLPATASCKEVELNLQLLMAVAISASKGYAAEETGRAFARAQALSHTISNNTLSFQSRAGVWCYDLLRGNFHNSLKLAQQMLVLAGRTHNWAYLLNAQMAMGCSLFYLGNISASHEHLQEVGSQYDLERFQASSPAYGWDPGVAAACYDAMALWLLGYPIRAEYEAQKALTLAHELSTPYHSALAGGMLSVYYMYRGDVNITLSVAETTVELSAENGFYHWLAAGRILKGWALVRQGNRKDGLKSLTEGIANWESTTGAQMLVPTWRILLAEAFLARGDCAKALCVTAESMALSKKTHESYYDAELHRIRGEIILRSKTRATCDLNVDDAEAEFRRAIHIAQRQNAKSLELKATVSLCRVLRQQGKQKQARKMLDAIYGWFTEGFDTPDLKAAKRLIDELS